MVQYCGGSVNSHVTTNVRPIDSIDNYPRLTRLFSYLKIIHTFIILQSMFMRSIFEQ